MVTWHRVQLMPHPWQLAGPVALEWPPLPPQPEPDLERLHPAWVSDENAPGGEPRACNIRNHLLGERHSPLGEPQFPELRPAAGGRHPGGLFVHLPCFELGLQFACHLAVVTERFRVLWTPITRPQRAMSPPIRSICVSTHPSPWRLSRVPQAVPGEAPLLESFSQLTRHDALSSGEGFQAGCRVPPLTPTPPRPGRRGISGAGADGFGPQSRPSPLKQSRGAITVQTRRLHCARCRGHYGCTVDN